MKFDLRCDEKAGADRALAGYAERRIRAVMSGFKSHIQWARVKLAPVRDADGAKGQRCVVQLRLRNLPDVLFSTTDLNVRNAVDQAAERLGRVLSARMARMQPRRSAPLAY